MHLFSQGTHWGSPLESVHRPSKVWGYRGDSIWGLYWLGKRVRVNSYAIERKSLGRKPGRYRRCYNCCRVRYRKVFDFGKDKVLLVQPDLKHKGDSTEGHSCEESTVERRYLPACVFCQAVWRAAAAKEKLESSSETGHCTIPDRPTSCWFNIGHKAWRVFCQRCLDAEITVRPLFEYEIENSLSHICALEDLQKILSDEERAALKELQKEENSRDIEQFKLVPNLKSNFASLPASCRYLAWLKTMQGDLPDCRSPLRTTLPRRMEWINIPVPNAENSMSSSYGILEKEIGQAGDVGGNIWGLIRLHMNCPPHHTGIRALMR